MVKVSCVFQKERGHMRVGVELSWQVFLTDEPIFRSTVLILLEGQSDVITFGGLLSPLSQMPHSGDNYYYSFLVFNVKKKINSLINVIINFSSLKPFCIQSCHSFWSLMYIPLGNQSLYLYFYDNMMRGEERGGSSPLPCKCG